MLSGLNESIEHIETHLDAEVDVADLARIALTSEYHYRRMFSALAGMPLSEYIRRRRLTVAGAEVIAGRRTLLEVAFSAGYGSGEAFARAFRAFHGLGPDEARRSGAPVQSQPQISFRLTVEGSSAMQYRVVQKEAFRIVGRTARVPIVHQGMNESLVAFIRGLGRPEIERIEALTDGEPAGILGVSAHLSPGREEGSEFDYTHGVVSSQAAPPDLDTIEVVAGTWAVFASSGEFPLAIQYLWRDVFTQWFPSNPYATRPGPEILRTRLSPNGTHADGELWIPVEFRAR